MKTNPLNVRIFLRILWLVILPFIFIGGVVGYFKVFVGLIFLYIIKDSVERKVSASIVKKKLDEKIIYGVRAASYKEHKHGYIFLTENHMVFAPISKFFHYNKEKSALIDLTKVQKFGTSSESSGTYRKTHFGYVKNKLISFYCKELLDKGIYTHFWHVNKYKKLFNKLSKHMETNHGFNSSPEHNTL